MIIKLSGATFTKYIGTVDASGTVTKKDVTLTINPNPYDATVTLTASGYRQEGNSITVPYGTIVSYEVSKTGYVSKSGTFTVMSTGNTMTQNITLREVGSTEPEEPGTGGSENTGTYVDITWTTGYYKCTNNNTNITQTSTDTVKKNKCTQLFKKTDIPNGLVEVADGWQYRIEYWVSSTEGADARAETSTVSMQINDSIWDEYTIIAFNVSKVDGTLINTVSDDELNNAFKIKLT